jgi:hypothetical protein
MLRNTGSSIGLLRRCSGIERKAETGYAVCRLECRAVVLNALRAEEGIRPMGAVDVGAVGDR